LNKYINMSLSVFSITHLNLDLPHT
jgi:hypothetical protein